MGKQTPRASDESDPADAAAGSVDAEQNTPVSNNVTGRVAFDDRGNAVWEWALSTGKFGTEVSTARLRRLEPTALSLADDAHAGQPAVHAVPPTAPAVRTAVPAPSPKVKENRKGVAQGYSPYDSGLLVKAAGAVTSKKKDLRRLSEWMKLREQFTKKKR